jgi:hypothetical protein
MHFTNRLEIDRLVIRDRLVKFCIRLEIVSTRDPSIGFSYFSRASLSSTGEENI